MVARERTIRILHRLFKVTWRGLLMSRGGLSRGILGFNVLSFATGRQTSRMNQQLEQKSRVLCFRTEMNTTGVVRKYNSVDDFENTLFQDLLKIVHDYRRRSFSRTCREIPGPQTRIHLSRRPASSNLGANRPTADRSPDRYTSTPPVQNALPQAQTADRRQRLHRWKHHTASQ